MKNARTVNKALLTEWAAFNGGRSPRTKLAIDADISLSLVNQMFLGRVPGELNQLRIARATGIEQDQLFPLIVESKEKLA